MRGWRRRETGGRLCQAATGPPSGPVGRVGEWEHQGQEGAQRPKARCGRSMRRLEYQRKGPSFVPRATGSCSRLWAGDSPTPGNITPAALGSMDRWAHVERKRVEVRVDRDWRGTGHGCPGAHVLRRCAQTRLSLGLARSPPVLALLHSSSQQQVPELLRPGLGTKAAWRKWTQPWSVGETDTRRVFDTPGLGGAGSGAPALPHRARPAPRCPPHWPARGARCPC